MVFFLQNLMKRKRKLKKEKEKENGKEKERETVFFLIGRKKKPPPRGETAHSLYLQLPCGLTYAACIW